LADLKRRIEHIGPDFVVISSFNRILPKNILALSEFINVHYSPLPQYRGRANVNWAIINGEDSAAISIHHVSEGLDDGGILYQELVSIGANDTATSIYARLNAIQERELGPAVHRALAGAAGSSQNQAEATYGCARLPEDGEIDWRQKTIAIDRLIRGLSPPFPGAFTFLNGRRLRVLRAAPRHDAPRYEGRIPGRVVNLSRSEGWVDVLTGDGILRVHDVATDTGVTCAAATLISSTRMSLGLSRLDLLRRVEALEARLVALEAQRETERLIQ
jgi:methionyl-tRNA formyltransferase